MKILLAIDDSKFAEAATEFVVRKMRSDNSEICVLHVVEPVWFVLDYESGELGQLEASRVERLKRGKSLVEGLKQSIMKAGFKVIALVEEGDPRLVVADRASQWKADLIVVGSHGRKGIGRLLIGSLAEFVARHAPCSVLVVRHNADHQ